MTPKQYTELFFLDEATALAAGHRPCAECRREEFRRFHSAWCAGQRQASGNTSTSATAIDYQLHFDRRWADGAQLLTQSELIELPTGTMVELPSVGYCLWWRQKLFRWTTVGYELVTNTQPLHSGIVQLLTPASIVEALRHGYVPIVHSSVDRLLERSPSHHEITNAIESDDKQTRD